MCVYLNEIENTVNDFVRDNKLFTAYDVTVAVRQNVKDRVSHKDVKREVHKMFDSGSLFGYNRTLANLAGVNPQPWIYHPLAEDASTYTGDAKVTKSSGNVFVDLGLPNPVAAVVASLSTLPDELHEFDSTDRLCVPAKLVRQLGLHEHDEAVLVTVSNDEFSILSKSNAQTWFADYVVDRYDNVRVSRATLLKNGVDGNKFEITGDANKVTVKKRS